MGCNNDGHICANEVHDLLDYIRSPQACVKIDFDEYALWYWPRRAAQSKQCPASHVRTGMFLPHVRASPAIESGTLLQPANAMAALDTSSKL